MRDPYYIPLTSVEICRERLFDALEKAKLALLWKGNFELFRRYWQTAKDHRTRRILWPDLDAPCTVTSLDQYRRGANPADRP